MLSHRFLSVFYLNIVPWNPNNDREAWTSAVHIGAGMGSHKADPLQNIHTTGFDIASEPTRDERKVRVCNQVGTLTFCR